jgi:hypothetical protein
MHVGFYEVHGVIVWVRGNCLKMNGEFTHYYAWGNNPVRKLWKGKKCRIIAVGTMGSCRVKFEDGGELITSRRALRKIKKVKGFTRGFNNQ